MRVLARPISSYIFSEQRRCWLLDARRALFGQPPSTDGTLSPQVQISAAAARELYVRWIGLNFAVELGRHVPRSVTSYNAEQLQILFGSAPFLSRLGNNNYAVCAASPGPT